MVDSDTISSAIADIPCPNSALNMQKLVFLGIGEAYGHKRALVVFLIHVGKEISGKSARFREIFGVTQSLFIRGVLSLAVYPDLFLVCKKISVF